MFRYEKEFKRIENGKNHVEVVCPLNEHKRDYIEQFRKEHPNTSTEWFNHRFNEKISLDEIVELLDGIPRLEEHLTVLSAGYITYYPIAKDPIQSFKNAILEQVPNELSANGALFLKRDVIDWMEKKTKTDPMFIFRLNSDFVDDYIQLHSAHVTENKDISKEDFFKSLANDILKYIESILKKCETCPLLFGVVLVFADLNQTKIEKYIMLKEK